MLSRRSIALLLLGCACLAGCERPKAGPSQPTAPATQPTTQAPLPETRPATSTLVIGNQLVSFPRARLVVRQNAPQVVLLLFSDDPRDAIDARYTGSRYYMEIKLDIDDLAQLSSAEWHYKAASLTRADSPDGIFLDGDRQQLQPYDATITFSENGPAVNMNIHGQFLLFQDRDRPTPPELKIVQGMLTAEPEISKKILN